MRCFSLITTLVMGTVSCFSFLGCTSTSLNQISFDTDSEKSKEIQSSVRVFEDEHDSNIVKIDLLDSDKTYEDFSDTERLAFDRLESVWKVEYNNGTRNHYSARMQSLRKQRQIYLTNKSKPVQEDNDVDTSLEEKENKNIVENDIDKQDTINDKPYSYQDSVDYNNRVRDRFNRKAGLKGKRQSNGYFYDEHDNKQKEGSEDQVKSPSVKTFEEDIKDKFKDLSKNYGKLERLYKSTGLIDKNNKAKLYERFTEIKGNIWKTLSQLEMIEVDSSLSKNKDSLIKSCSKQKSILVDLEHAVLKEDKSMIEDILDKLSDTLSKDFK